MKTIRSACVALLVGLLSACSSSKSEMRVTGHVFSGTDASPIPGAEVSLQAGSYDGTYDFNVTGSETKSTGSGGNFDVTVEVDSDAGHDYGRLTVKANGYSKYTAELPFADRKDHTVILSPQ